MQLTADYHTHTPYSHGKNTVLENTKAAKKVGLKEIGITDHGFNHLLFGLKRRNLTDLRKEIDEAERLTGVKVLMGMESNLISVDGNTDMKPDDLRFFDLYLCGIHEVLKYKSFSDMRNIMIKNYMAYKFGKKPSDKVVETTTKAYVNAIKNNPIDILTHINYKCYCNLKELNLMASTGVRFVIDSDAHSADRVGDTRIAEELLNLANISPEQIDNIDGRLPKFRFKEYKAKNF